MGDGGPTGRWTDPACPVARTVDLVGDRWSLLILRDAFDGSRSFTDFHRGLGVARNILTERLRRLADDGLLCRRTAASGRRQEYVLTGAGRDLFATLLALRQWGEAHAFDDGETHSVLVDDTTGDPVPPLRALRSDGTVVGPDDARVEKLRGTSGRAAPGSRDSGGRATPRRRGPRPGARARRAAE